MLPRTNLSSYPSFDRTPGLGEMPRKNASGKTRALGFIDKAYPSHLTLLKRMSSLLNKVAELSILTDAHIFMFVQSEQSVFPWCFTTNRQGDAYAHVSQLYHNWPELEKTTRVYNTLDHPNIKQGDAVPTEDVAEGQGLRRGPKAQKKQQGQDAAKETTLARDERESKEPLQYFYRHNETPLRAKAVGTQFSDVIVWHDLEEHLLKREISKAGARVSDRVTKGDVVRKIAKPNAWALEKTSTAPAYERWAPSRSVDMSVLSRGEEAIASLPGYLRPVRSLNYADPAYGSMTSVATPKETSSLEKPKKSHKRTRKGNEKPSGEATVPLMYNQVSSRPALTYPLGGAPMNGGGSGVMTQTGFSWTRGGEQDTAAAMALAALGQNKDHLAALNHSMLPPEVRERVGAPVSSNVSQGLFLVMPPAGSKQNPQLRQVVQLSNLYDQLDDFLSSASLTAPPVGSRPLSLMGTAAPPPPATPRPEMQKFHSYTDLLNPGGAAIAQSPPDITMPCDTFDHFFTEGFVPPDSPAFFGFVM